MARQGIDWRYTETRRRDFLRVLAETYDVAAALTEARLTWPQVCELRVRHPDFAERFEEVIAAGYDRLEALLLRAAGVGGGKVDPALAQALLKQRRTGTGDSARGGRGAGKAARIEPDQGKALAHIKAQLAPLQAAAARGAWNGRTADGLRPGQPAGTIERGEPHGP